MSFPDDEQFLDEKTFLVKQIEELGLQARQQQSHSSHPGIVSA